MNNQKLKEIKKGLLGYTVDLVTLDNFVQDALGTIQSLFDDYNEVIAQESASYYLEEDKNLIIEFETERIIDKTAIVNIINIWID